ncbi:hypothetical protein RHP75_08500 [Pseudomonas sp. SG20056]|uniref:hypothetical protein n=1 Tax=Pseudomonas sp. SG20056 TaxID=3074146 RepID=UPI00287F4AF3|nr:hypothetical protein [Pseudomonas sp. SG20056]WNF48438.1 hypothetical protein RHP75_08500 [Pseudomonas sp. SG20056]
MNRFFILSNPVIAIRGRYYVNVLLRRLGVRRVAQVTSALIEMAGYENATIYSKYRADFYRYMNGGNIKNENLVKAVDNLLPGTARIVHHPIWSLLSTRGAEKEVLIELAQKLQPNLHQFLLKYDEDTYAIDLRSLSKYRGWFRSGSHFLRTIDLRSLDELAALVIAIESHEMRGEYNVSRLLRELTKSFFVELSLMAEFDEIIEKLYEEVHRRISDVICGEKCDGEMFLMFAQILALEDSEWMLKIIRKVSAGRASHDGKYSEILRCNRAA